MPAFRRMHCNILCSRRVLFTVLSADLELRDVELSKRRVLGGVEQGREFTRACSRQQYGSEPGVREVLGLRNGQRRLTYSIMHVPPFAQNLALWLGTSDRPVGALHQWRIGRLI